MPKWQRARFVPQPTRQPVSESRAEAQPAKAADSRSRVTRVRVRYADTDRMGIAYHANYLVWFEVGRTEWLRAGGWTYREMEEDGVSLPVIEAHCEYRQPARYDDEIEISTAATVLSEVRIRFDYEARLTRGSGPAATGHTVHAAVGADGRPRRLPPRVLEYLK
jgi:acyl-CoA thioester hydrolase